MEKMKKENEVAHRWLERLTSHNRQAHAHFPDQRYGLVTSSIAESINAVLKNARQMPICQLIEHTRMKVGQWYNQGCMKASWWIGSITPYIGNIMLTNEDLDKHAMVMPASLYIFQVNTIFGVMHFHDLMDLQKRTCSCRQFQDQGFLCEHGMVCINHREYNPCNYMEKYFHMSKYIDGVLMSSNPHQEAISGAILINGCSIPRISR